jgi:hypothetical protein
MYILVAAVVLGQSWHTHCAPGIDDDESAFSRFACSAVSGAAWIGTVPAKAGIWLMDPARK